MPALTSPSQHTDSGPGAHHTTLPSTPSTHRAQRQFHDQFLNHALYDTGTHSFYLTQYTPSPYFYSGERVYPPAGHSFPGNPQSFSHPSPMFSYFSLPPQPQSAWQNHVHVIQPSPQPPPQLAHKVWILDCKSCGMFLTNRGMKAVLLLRPNVSLFSTDALPVNCSAYTTNPDALRPSSCRPSTSQAPPRTCECLTQTLCCHGCGTAVGYMIVIPCSRCTSSITATNRATNGHRFVFHSSEIVASQRHYVPDEPGVIPLDIPLSQLPPASLPSLSQNSHPVTVSATSGSLGVTLASRSAPLSAFPSHVSLELHDVSFSSAASSSESLSHLQARPASPLRSPRTMARSPPPNPPPRQPLPVPMLVSSQPAASSSSSSSSSSPEPRGMPVEQRDGSSARKLKAGDILYWHHLTRTGEIPGVQEDARAREPKEKVKLHSFSR